jgi:predicted DNA binding CopG/RHH family protein
MRIQKRGQVMTNVEERARFDDYELEGNYDFSDSIRGRFYKSKKIRTTLQLDNDILLFLKKQASEKHIKYQVLVNSLLRDYMSEVVK